MKQVLFYVIQDLFWVVNAVIRIRIGSNTGADADPYSYKNLLIS